MIISIFIFCSLLLYNYYCYYLCQNTTVEFSSESLSLNSNEQSLMQFFASRGRRGAWSKDLPVGFWWQSGT